MTSQESQVRLGVPRSIDRKFSSQRVTFGPSQVAVVLQMPVRCVLDLVATGELTNVSMDGDPQFDPFEVCERAEGMVAEGALTPLALWVARLIFDCRLDVSPVGEDDVPALPLDVLQEGIA